MAVTHTSKAPAVRESLQRHRTVIALWVLAGAAMLAIWVYQRSGDDSTGPDRSVADAPLRDPSDRSPDRVARETRRASIPRAGAPSMFRLDARRSGQSAHSVAARVVRRWRYEAAGRITAQPVLGADATVLVGAHDGSFYAVRDGQLVWRRPLGGPIYATAALSPDGRTLYVGCDADRFFALDVRTGAIRWTIRTEGDADTSAVLRSDGVLIFGAGNDLWAVRARDGVVAWRFRARDKVYASPALDGDDTIYFGSQDNYFYALDRDGRMRWSYKTQDDNDASPAIGDDGTVYFGSDDEHVYALSPEGELRWSTDLDGYVRAAIALGRDGSVIAATHGPRPRIVALDPTTGEQRWSFSTEITQTRDLGILSAPTVAADGTIYVGAQDDYLYAINPNGRLRWVQPMRGDVDSSPIIGPDGTLYVGSDDRGLWAFGPAPDLEATIDEPPDAGEATTGSDVGATAASAADASQTVTTLDAGVTADASQSLDTAAAPSDTTDSATDGGHTATPATAESPTEQDGGSR